jgi:hypothetical protein
LTLGGNEFVVVLAEIAGAAEAVGIAVYGADRDQPAEIRRF